jgi:hypothetical protein
MRVALWIEKEQARVRPDVMHRAAAISLRRTIVARAGGAASKTVELIAKEVAINHQE